MDALKFLREVKKICDYYTRTYHDCLKCPIVDMPCRTPVTDWGDSVLNTFVERVEQWSKEHPQRTRLQDFREKYPNVSMETDGAPAICCIDLGYRKEDCDPIKESCVDCWNMPVEDE